MSLLGGGSGRSLLEGSVLVQIVLGMSLLGGSPICIFLVRGLLGGSLLGGGTGRSLLNGSLLDQIFLGRSTLSGSLLGKGIGRSLLDGSRFGHPRALVWVTTGVRATRSHTPPDVGADIQTQIWKFHGS